ncbi:hypothetical protein OESDEN_09455 [Oesophagostomum dentatum]|uniref:Uncharacterized protein n=1 Tax=Oesophagostomum dentatum TaxID=61180 RepID=A0A0B1SZK9_OESDE|nr:hypothetical protein OESDEN_09455 [Oesophagostomum dentatum]
MSDRDAHAPQRLQATLRMMRALVCVLIALFCALLVSAQLEKRASMGGSAFGAMDRIPPGIPPEVLPNRSETNLWWRRTV